jgi:hypothetical protein
MPNDGWSVVRIKVPLKARIAALAKAEGVSTAAWIDRALDAALRDGQGASSKEQASPAPVASPEAPRLAAPRRASGERARPAAAAGGGAIESPPGPGSPSALRALQALPVKTSAEAKRGVKPIPKAKR